MFGAVWIQDVQCVRKNGLTWLGWSDPARMFGQFLADTGMYAPEDTRIMYHGWIDTCLVSGVSGLVSVAAVTCHVSRGERTACCGLSRSAALYSNQPSGTRRTKHVAPSEPVRYSVPGINASFF